MFLQVAIGSALVSSSVAALLPPSPALITPAPQIELLKKQNNERYMGWIADTKGAWSTELCDYGNKYYQDSSRWACCATGRTDCGTSLAVNCVNGNMVFPVVATGSASLSASYTTKACSAIWTASSDASFTLCNTAYMFENDRDSSPKVNIVCGISSLNWSYYRNAPAAATQVSSARASSARSLTIPGRVSATPTSSATPNPVTVTAPDADTGGTSKTKSKAWIAGAVVGPILGLAIIGLAACFFIRRKKNKSRNQKVAPATGSMPPPGAISYQQNTYSSNQGAPQYYPDMQQDAGAAPHGASKQDAYYISGANLQSPVSSPSPQSPYGAAPQQWQQQGAQPVYGAPSPSMSPVPQNVQPAQYMASGTRPFSSELEGNYQHGQSQIVNVQPNK